MSLPGLILESNRIEPSEVRGLSLGEVTEAHGTAGLYVRLKETLKDVELYDNPLIQKSLLLGLRLHENDKRTSGHYHDHLLRVTLHLTETLGIRDPNIIAAAPLHDSLEDHATEIVQLLTGIELDEKSYTKGMAACALTLFTNEAVTGHIISVTNPPLLDGQDKNTAYYNHSVRQIRTLPAARALKLADFIDNAVGNHATADPGLQRRLDLKYTPVYAAHMIGLCTSDSLVKGEYQEKALRFLLNGHTRACGRIALAAAA